jgi:hypothetical protein
MKKAPKQATPMPMDVLLMEEEAGCQKAILVEENKKEINFKSVMFTMTDFFSL